MTSKSCTTLVKRKPFVWKCKISHIVTFILMQCKVQVLLKVKVRFKSWTWSGGNFNLIFGGFHGFDMFISYSKRRWWNGRPYLLCIKWTWHSFCILTTMLRIYTWICVELYNLYGEKSSLEHFHLIFDYPISFLEVISLSNWKWWFYTSDFKC